MAKTTSQTVLVVGGAGYVGSSLVPKLLQAGHKVRVLDLYLFGTDVFPTVKGHPNLVEIKGDMRDERTVDEAVAGCDSIIHLACISNDPSFELDPNLGKSINYDCFPMMLATAHKHGIKRFVYASSSSVYGVKKDDNVTEDLPLEPLTDYSKYKALCEELLLKSRKPGSFVPLIIRPATVCGYAPRLRLDVIVNIMTNLAVNTGKMTVHGGDQMRPNIHIDDMSDLYVQSLTWPEKVIDGKIYNVGYHNHTVMEIAQMVKRVVGDHVQLIVEPTNDPRSYRISSARIAREVGFEAKRSIEDAARTLVEAFKAGKLPNSLTDKRYSNIKTLQAVGLK